MCKVQALNYEADPGTEVVIELRPRLFGQALIVSADVSDATGGSASYEAVWPDFLQLELPFP